MVCAVKAVPIEEVLAQVNQGDKVALITCNTCVRSQDAGGASIMLEIASKLRETATVTDEIVMTTGCFEDQFTNAHWSGKAEKVILFACDAGWSVIKRNMKPSIPVILAARTLGVPLGTKIKPIKTIGGT